MGTKKSKKDKSNKKKDSIKQTKSNSRLNAADLLRVELQISRIVNRFDYEKVHKVMTFLDWKWFNPGSEDSTVPTIERLISSSRYLLTQAATAKESTWSSGGFIARRYECGGLGLTFYVSDITENNPDNNGEDEEED